MDTSGAHDERTLSVWREAREWWLAAPYVERTKYVDEKGIRRVRDREARSLGAIDGAPPKAYEDDNSEEIVLRLAKSRDEKVSAACGKMPEQYYERAIAERAGPVAPVQGATLRSLAGFQYAPLHLFTGYAFGRSVMLAEEAAGIAAQAGCPAAAIADPHSLVGVHEFSRACRRMGIKPLIGTSIELPEGGEIVLIATTKRGYRNLSRLVTACHLGEPRQFPLGSWERLAEHAEDLVCLTGGYWGPLDRLLTRRDFNGALALVERLVSVYGRGNVFLEVERSFLPWGRMVEEQILELAAATGTKPVAGGGVGQGRRADYPAQDALMCVESLCLIEEVIGRKPRRHESQPQVKQHPERSLNAEKYLRPCVQMSVLFADRPELLRTTLAIADRCEEDVLPGMQALPTVFEDDDRALAEIVEAQAHWAYGTSYDQKHRGRLTMEVTRIQRMGYSSHFLVAWDYCRWAREQGVGMSGRGSVVDSAVAYVLGLSRIDAIEHNLHFGRFLPEDGSKRPDIDIDFEARRRDDVRGYVIRKYGKDRVAGLAAIGSYRVRGIVRDVSKVFGIPEETVGFLAKKIHGSVSPDELESALERRPELRGANIPKEKFRWVLAFAKSLMDVPTGMGLHSSGLVVTACPTADVAPVQWSASPSSAEAATGEGHLRQIQWDKRSAKYCFDKFDILCLRGQDLLSGVESRVRSANPDFSSERLTAVTDPEVYRAMRSGELIGVPQSASPAMRQAHQRLRTDNLHEASLVQAGIRPGVGGAVKLNELIARHRGKPFEFEHPDFEEILGNTYGIIVFQEQVDLILEKFCGYSSGRAEDIRDAMYKKRRDGFAEEAKEQIIGDAMARGYGRPVADHVYELVSQFKGYGFAQGHALAFAEVSLRSVRLMQDHPAEYFASLLSAQPAGYYGSVTIANEARSRGVRMLGLDVNRSRELFEVDESVDEQTGICVPNSAIRTGLMQLKGLSKPTLKKIVAEQEAFSVGGRTRNLLGTAGDRRGGVSTLDPSTPGSLLAFGSFFDFARRVQPSRDELESLILAGAFDGLHRNRRALLWSLKAAQDFAAAHRSEGAAPVLPLDYEEPPLDLSVADFSGQEKAVWERALLEMDVEQHLMAYERERVASRGGLSTDDARRQPAGTKVMAVGNPIRLRFPPTQSGRRVCFFDLEDETGLLNCTAFDDVYQRYGHAIVTSQYCAVRGVIQDRDGHPAFMVHSAFPYAPVLARSVSQLPVGSADFLVG